MCRVLRIFDPISGLCLALRPAPGPTLRAPRRDPFPGQGPGPDQDPDPGLGPSRGQDQGPGQDPARDPDLARRFQTETDLWTWVLVGVFACVALAALKYENVFPYYFYLRLK